MRRRMCDLRRLPYSGRFGGWCRAAFPELCEVDVVPGTKGASRTRGRSADGSRAGITRLLQGEVRVGPHEGEGGEVGLHLRYMQVTDMSNWEYAGVWKVDRIGVCRQRTGGAPAGGCRIHAKESQRVEGRHSCVCGGSGTGAIYRREPSEDGCGAKGGRQWSDWSGPDVGRGVAVMESGDMPLRNAIEDRGRCYVRYDVECVRARIGRQSIRIVGWK